MKRIAACTFYVAATATLAANIYESNHTVVGVVTGLWAPLALFLSLELVERCLEARWARWAVGFLAMVAAYVSYWHLVHVFAEGGADQVSRYALPFTVDLLMAISRVAMVTKTKAAVVEQAPAPTLPTPQEEVVVEVPMPELPAAEERGGVGFINHREHCTHAATPAARRACREARRLTA